MDASSGLCWMHRPGAKKRLAEQGRKGAEATARKNKGPGLDPEELGALETHADAKRWLEAIARAVLAGDLQERQAREGRAALEAWCRVEGGEDHAHRVGRFVLELMRNPELARQVEQAETEEDLRQLDLPEGLAGLIPTGDSGGQG